MAIWSDDFEVDRWTSYYERDNAGGNFRRTTTMPHLGTTSMHGTFSPGGNAGSMWAGFGAMPSPGFFAFAPLDAGTATYRDVTATFWLRTASPWTHNNQNLKLARMSVFANSNAAQAAILHLWSYADPGTTSDNERLMLDPARGTDASGNLVSTTWNDFANLTFLGSAASTTHVASQANLNRWFKIGLRMRLNDSGSSNGLAQLYIDDVLEAERTGLNYLGSYSTFGINTVSLENSWNGGSPATQSRFFDDFTIAVTTTGQTVTGDAGAYALSGAAATLQPQLIHSWLRVGR